MVSFKTAPIARNETTHGWQRASWDEYLHHRDNPTLDRIQLFFQSHVQSMHRLRGTDWVPISLLTEALTKLETMDNGVVAFWIAHQLSMLPR